ncbi:type II secretion system F family protein [Ostreibacterium oceani]|uniref:Type II secretion system protein GspF domain-containing protein n=1 Tax=Ostreibacterium oceani TaxID=2654998 RepID=A0A6N7EV20_9GAMM|nr:hypothetical protein [Ostreibacterium oceani]MPV85455.1 hypothetical protein [Ostreibacterium oceani]
MLEIFFNYFNHNETQLDEVSRTVMAAEDKPATLEKLQSNLAPRYQKSLSMVSMILAGNINKLPSKGLGLWHGLFHLAKCGNISLNQYVLQYNRLEQSRLDLSEIYKLNPVAYWYFAMMVIVSVGSSLISRIKVLPVFEDFFGDFGAELPAVTQWMLHGHYFWFSTVAFLIILLLAFLLPIHLRKNMSQLKPIPSYFKLIPLYYPVVRSYHQYLLLMYMHCGHFAGEGKALQVAQKALPKIKINQNTQAFLAIAEEMGAIDNEILFRKQAVIRQLLQQTKAAEGTMAIFVLLIFIALSVIPVYAMYLPIFQLGDIAS